MGSRLFRLDESISMFGSWSWKCTIFFALVPWQACFLGSFFLSRSCSHNRQGLHFGINVLGVRHNHGKSQIKMYKAFSLLREQTCSIYGQMSITSTASRNFEIFSALILFFINFKKSRCRFNYIHLSLAPNDIWRRNKIEWSRYLNLRK